MPRLRVESHQQYDETQSTFERGVARGTCDSTGSLVINYSLASAPTTFIAQPIGTTQYFTTVVNMTATGSTIRFFTTASGNAGAVAVTASWVAWV